MTRIDSNTPIFVFPRDNGSIEVRRNEADNKYSFEWAGIIEEQTTLKVVEVVSPIPGVPLEAFTEKELPIVLSQCHPILTKYDKSSYKITLTFGLKGGVTDVKALIAARPDISPQELASAIIRNLPEGTFRSVNVTHIDYDFFNTVKPAFAISLHPSGYLFMQLLKSLRELFMGYHPSNPKMYNATAVVNYIMGINQSQEGNQDLVDAYNDNRRLDIFVSLDGKTMLCVFQMEKMGLFDYRLCVVL